MKKEWIQNDNGLTKEAIEWAEEFARTITTKLQDRRYRKKPMTTSQMRRFFGEVRRIDSNKANISTGIIMLKPMLAYAVGRDEGETRIDEFGTEISKAIDAIRIGSEHEYKDFKNLVKLLEALVAYHKYFSKKQ